ncbi:leucine-rich repeat flightless-interacting protein 2 [Megalobrama amblycephala]|uniref:leucine-rich repeat flightless-interacting protein 2 n=1 Tax=Megalobrama amblycephala TaxID=75352 RepID=UPI002013F057|nr:leucine-rich repeat flightless-interacting protein 2 [Megalobrama amblycephala]
MHSGQLEKTGSLRKRTLSRGMSEDESLRHIIREAEESSRHLSRSDSRYGSLKRGQREESQSEDEPLSENIEMTDEDCVQELRTLSLQQDALLFQVDCLQDALEGAEEMLAETQRETHQLTMELERERTMRRKLEDMLASLMQEMERLREERKAEQLQARHAGPVWIQGTPEGTSVDREETPLSDSRGAPAHLNAAPVLHLKKLVNHSLSQSVSDNQRHEAPAGEDNDESSGYEDAPSEFSPCPSTPDLDEDDGMNTGQPRIRSNEDSCALS